jgi:hypothetical protein
MKMPALLLTLALSGCTTLSENECLTADWESIGYSDGSRGYNSGRIGNHTEACQEHGVTPDSKEYEAGRQRGLETYCTARNGLRVGQQGNVYSGACPSELESSFLRGYDVGRDMTEVEARMQRLRAEMQDAQLQLRRKEPPLSERERDYLIYRLRDLEREFGRYEFQLRNLEREARSL